MLSSASDELKEHLSTVMNGSGAVINLDGVPYNIDVTKLTTATNNFISHLGTISGNGSKVVIGGVEYGIDSSKVAGTVSALDTAFAELENGGEERLEGDGGEYYTLCPTPLSFRSTAPLNELQEVKINGNVVDPSNYTLEEGSTIVTLPINYLKTLNVGNYEVDVVSNSKSVKGGFTVAAPELNEYGFYYNQPYTAFVAMFGENDSLLIHEDGTLDVIGNSSGAAVKGVYTINDNLMTVETSLTGALTVNITNGSTEMFCNELQTSFTLGGENTFSDDEYLYVYDDSIEGYQVFAIDRTKPYYKAIRTNINNIPTTKLGSRMFSLHDYAGHPIDNEYILESPEMPDTIRHIGEDAFTSCTSLTSITIPDGVISIENSAFYDCTSLTSATVGNSVTTIGSRAFAHCTSLTSVIIGNSIKTIGDWAFSYCDSLTSIVIPDSVTSIDQGTFEYCTSLTSIVIPGNITRIRSSLFHECYSLTDIIFTGTTAQWNAITKDAEWNYTVPATHVHCTDGDVAL